MNTLLVFPISRLDRIYDVLDTFLPRETKIVILLICNEGDVANHVDYQHFFDNPEVELCLPISLGLNSKKIKIPDIILYLKDIGVSAENLEEIYFGSEYQLHFWSQISAAKLHESAFGHSRYHCFKKFRIQIYVHMLNFIFFTAKTMRTIKKRSGLEFYSKIGK